MKHYLKGDKKNQDPDKLLRLFLIGLSILSPVAIIIIIIFYFFYG